MFCVEKETFLKIISNYDRNEKSFEEDVNRIHEWLKTQPHLPEIMDKKRIQNFLLMNKCRIETTKHCIDNYYTIRTAVPEFFQDVDSKEIKRLKNSVYFIQLPKLTQEGHRIHVVKVVENAPLDKVNPPDFISHCVHVQEIRLKEEVFNKDVLIFDIEGVTVSYILKLTPSVMYKTLKLYEKVYSNRLAAAYFIHLNSYFDKVMAILKAFLKPKLFERIEILKDHKILLQKLSKEILPKDFGGNEKSLKELSEIQQLKINEYKNYLKELGNMKVDEGLRPEKLKNDDLLGFYGNFKKLEID